jgi:hypothetical protein
MKYCDLHATAEIEDKDILDDLASECQDCKCENGNHKFVECDEWGATCINCGELE